MKNLLLCLSLLVVPAFGQDIGTKGPKVGERSLSDDVESIPLLNVPGVIDMVFESWIPVPKEAQRDIAVAGLRWVKVGPYQVSRSLVLPGHSSAPVARLAWTQFGDENTMEFEVEWCSGGQVRRVRVTIPIGGNVGEALTQMEKGVRGMQALYPPDPDATGCLAESVQTESEASIRFMADLGFGCSRVTVTYRGNLRPAQAEGELAAAAAFARGKFGGGC